MSCATGSARRLPRSTDPPQGQLVGCRFRLTTPGWHSLKSTDGSGKINRLRVTVEKSRPDMGPRCLAPVRGGPGRAGGGEGCR